MDDNLTQSNAAPAQVSDERLRLQRERRRRFIRLGAGSVPVGLTLTSRPVMAWHCYTTSAWGSQRADGVAPGTSVYGRLEANVGTTRINGNECWSIANWRNNSSGSGFYAKRPWTYVGDQLRPSRAYKNQYGQWKTYTDDDQAKHARETLTVGHVFQNGPLLNIAGTTKCWDVIGNGVTTLADHLLIAGLNRRFAQSGHRAVMNMCLRPNNYTGPDQLDEMARSGIGYKPPGRSTPWDEADIRKYLHESWLARA